MTFLTRTYNRVISLTHDAAPTKSGDVSEHVEHFTCTWEEEHIHNGLKTKILRYHDIAAFLTLLTTAKSTLRVLKRTVSYFSDLTELLINEGILPNDAYFSLDRFWSLFSDGAARLPCDDLRLQIFEPIHRLHLISQNIVPKM